MRHTKCYCCCFDGSATADCFATLLRALCLQRKYHLSCGRPSQNSCHGQYRRQPRHRAVPQPLRPSHGVLRPRREALQQVLRRLPYLLLPTAVVAVLPFLGPRFPIESTPPRLVHLCSLGLHVCLPRVHAGVYGAADTCKHQHTSTQHQKRGRRTRKPPERLENPFWRNALSSGRESTLVQSLVTGRPGASCRLSAMPSNAWSTKSGLSRRREESSVCWRSTRTMVSGYPKKYHVFLSILSKLTDHWITRQGTCGSSCLDGRDIPVTSETGVLAEWWWWWW